MQFKVDNRLHVRLRRCSRNATGTVRKFRGPRASVSGSGVKCGDLYGAQTPESASIWPVRYSFAELRTSDCLPRVSIKLARLCVVR